MKRVNRINQILLKKYPLVWNTRLVWLLLIGGILHLCFFGLGFINISDPESLHDHNAADIFFTNGVFLLNMLISIILIVGWLIFMFKNNSFKSFYPTTKNNLFRHFLFYFIIIFVNITYYYSYFYGMKTSVNLNHPTQVVGQDIVLSNKTAPFFSHFLGQYDISNKQYPAYFKNVVCETKTELINIEKPHLKFLDKYYQFYTIRKSEKSYEKGQRGDPYIYYEELNDSINLYYYRDTVIDVSEKISTVLPSYYNFSDLFFYDKKGFYYDYRERSHYYRFDRDSFENNVIQFHNNLLNRNNSNEIKKILDDFLKVASKYKIPTNLTTENWFSLIHTDSFLIKNLIRNFSPKIYGRNGYHYQDWGENNSKNVFDENGNRIKTIREEFIESLLTDSYLESDKLRNVFSNIKEIKKINPFVETIHFFLWFSFFLACLIFIYRTSGLKSLIFSSLVVGILTVLLALAAMGFDFLIGGAIMKIDTFMFSLIWIIGTIILSVPIFYLKKNNKMVSSICINISLTFFAMYIFLILQLISIFQEYLCIKGYKSYDPVKNTCITILEYVGIYWSYILFFMAFIFIYFFTEVIRKWKALPENK